MKLLNDILNGISPIKIEGSKTKNIENITFDSRKCMPNSLFVAIKGEKLDGHKYIHSAIEKGATTIVLQDWPDEIKETVTYIQVTNTSKELGKLAANFYDQASTNLQLIGVTGTNGKTTIATLLYRLFKSLGYKTGLISTIKYLVDEEEITSTLTTPDAIQLNRLMAQMVEIGCEYCFMEVSSHAVDQHRIEGLHFAGGVFTNLSHDHLDYHQTFDAYLKAKKTFFDQLPKSAFALVNIDDKRGRVMVQNTKANIQSYALKSMADFKAKVLENNFDGMLIEINNQQLYSLLVGDFNAYNVTAIYATAILLDIEPEEALVKISQLKTAEGRFDYMVDQKNKIVGIVDYAHTPDALEKVLKTINQIRTKNEQLITVVGCGGDRDKTKRPLMAKVACSLSDRIILTSDNPRTENPDKIIEDMQQGVAAEYYNKVLSITNRKEAIKTAGMMAQEGDIILIAGKGHENYQEINGERFPFDDKEIWQEIMNKKI